MSRYAQIEGGVVVNLVRADEAFAVAHGLVETGEGAEIGGGYDAGTGVWSPAPPPPLDVPTAIDMRQTRLKLLTEPHEPDPPLPAPFDGGTRLDAVDAYVATQPALVQIEWQYARELRRDHPMVAIMGLFFGLDSDDLDLWFVEAAAIGPTQTI